jgi:hypothetical protein
MSDNPMARLQRICDEQGYPYPPELAEHLALTLKLREQDDES